LQTQGLEEFAATLKRVGADLEHQRGGHPEYYRYYAAQALFQGDYDAWQKWNDGRHPPLQRRSAG